MKALSCPSCGGHLELPDNLEVAHCMYCGVKILLQEDEIPKERQNIKRYKELCKTALDAKNYEDALRYSNKMLEIDPRDVEAWIDKSVSTYWLSTEANNRYDEALEYLNKAAQIAPEDIRIDEAKKLFIRLKVFKLNDLGNKSYNRANKIYQDRISSIDAARRESTDFYVEAMKYYLAASNYWPGDINILANIANCRNTAFWINWSKTVSDKVDVLIKLRAKAAAKERLSQLNKELQETKEQLSKLKSNTGFLSGIKIGNAESRIRQLQREIAELEKTASFSV